MDIKILDSWLREHLETNAKPKDIAKALSLTSASVEKIEAFNKDFLYHIEVTTNRVDMASVIGVAREAAAVLPQFGFEATYKNILAKHTVAPHNDVKREKEIIEIKNNDKLVKRICCVVLEITQKESPEYIKDRLESAGIRSLNNLIDVTNYIMLEIGHPTHAFDYDRLTTKKLVIRAAKKGEKIVTLDRKEHTLLGGDIIADNGTGEIVDLLGVMGLLNSVVTRHTKHILFLIDNNDSNQIRKTSMSLGIRTEAASLNEKDVDPELAMTALLRGIKLYQEIADAKIVSDIIDIYPNKFTPKTITITEEKIKKIIGVNIPLKQATEMLQRLHFGIKVLDKNLNSLDIAIPSYRNADMHIAEDVIEEIARMYGYQNLPSKLPSSDAIIPYWYANDFFWEKKVKDTLKYWGFTEVYTYSMVSEKLLKGVPKEAITLKNPLDEDHIYMRTALMPSLLEVLNENKSREEIRIFEIATVYRKRTHGLPEEISTLAGIMKGNTNFFVVKGIIEQLAIDLGIKNLVFKDLAKGGLGADVFIENKYLGEIEVLENDVIVFELDFTVLVTHATLKKIYTPIAKFPPILEDMAFIIDVSIKTDDIIVEIKKQSPLIVNVSLLDQYENKRTFHIVYQDKEKNLTNEQIEKIRKQIISSVAKKFGGNVK